MNFNEYQRECLKTAVYPKNYKIIYPALGLCGESGEVAEKTKKLIRDKNGKVDDDFLTLIKKELGDVMWYIASLCSDLELSLDDVAIHNIKKLTDRKERGVLQGNGDTR